MYPSEVMFNLNA